MRFEARSFRTSSLVVLAFFLSACSGLPPGSTTTNPGGGGGGNTISVTATIGGAVSGLVANTSLVLQNNGGDSLTVTANGPFTLKTPVTGTDVYAVTVLTQPTNPTQLCTVAGGSGTAKANVTNVTVSCVLS